jgi:peptidoglycan/LPS O-acetylase OafA/YrhL
MNKGLTSIRALAFFSIFIFHINVLGSGKLGMQGGYLGIQAFFVLSGFLLTPILLDMKANLNMKDFFIHFYGRRTLRIFPLYYSYIVIVAAISFLVMFLYGQSEISPMDRIRLITPLYRFIEQLPWTITYTYDFYHASSYFKTTLFANHFWSLAVEEQFYLVWPWAIFIISAKYLKRFLLLVIVVGPLIRFLLALTFDANILHVNSSKDAFIYVLPFSQFDAFAIGGYFALYGKSRASYLVWLFILLVLLLGVVTSWLSTMQIQWGQLGYGPYMKDSNKYIWGYSLVNLMFAYVLVHVRSKTFIPALFENPLLVYLGTISYGLYVFHLPVLWLVYSNMQNSPEIVRATTSLLITVIVSMLSYEFMEKRFINLKDKYFARASAGNVTKSILPK